MQQVHSNNDAHITVCATCTDTNHSGTSGVGGGEKLLALMQRELTEHPYKPSIRLQSWRCLMACSNGCAVSVASRGKVRYLLGNLPATENMAAQLLDFAALYIDSPTGVTPNHEWPGTIGMHFLGRMPPIDPAEGDWNEDGCDL